MAKGLQLITIFSLYLIFFTSCETQKDIAKDNSTTVTDEAKMKDLGFIKGTIKDFSQSNGCGFLIVLEESKQVLQTLKPIAASFQKDGLKVWLKYRPIRPISPTCKEGTPIDIEAIKKA